MHAYPLLARIQENLRQKGKDVEWLAPQVDRTVRWIYGLKEIEKVPFGILMNISEILQFDIVMDYYRFTGLHDSSVLSVVREPQESFYRARQIAVQVTVEGDINKFNTMLETLREEGEKQGYKVGVVSQ